MANTQRQHGAVSIFAVIFAALLLTTLTVGFIRLMMQEQQRATNNDLSQSALDSALAGVEDAKRVIRECATNSSSPACTALENPDRCRVVAQSGIAGSPTDDEVHVQSTTVAGEEFDQAYTCVDIAMNTDDYLFEAQESSVELIPLRATGEIREIIIEWLTAEDLGPGASVTAPTPASPALPPRGNDWGANTPPLLRAQLIRPGENFNLGDLDGDSASQTVFFRPGSVASGGMGTVVPMSQPRATGDSEYTNQPATGSCSSNFGNSGYSCRIILDVSSSPISQGASNNAFLRLGVIYRGATVRVTLPGTQFNGVQPAVDVTGRANDLFRRVESRLRIGDDFPYPNYAVDVNNSLCKNFTVADTAEAPGGAAGCSP